MLGGNLKGLASLVGTPWWPDRSGSVLFWESTDPLHTVCQHLTQLATAGVFDRITGMIIGRASTLTDTFYPPGRVLPVADLLLDVPGLRDRFPIAVEADLGHNVDNVAVQPYRVRRLGTRKAAESTMPSTPNQPTLRGKGDAGKRDWTLSANGSHGAPLISWRLR